MKTYRFYKDEYGWFIDLKWFPFNRGHLAMVCGADELLDKLSGKKKEVLLEVSTKPMEGSSSYLKRVSKLGFLNGAVYTPVSRIKIKNKIFQSNQLWLCAVTLLVFWHYPEKIYFNVKSAKK